MGTGRQPGHITVGDETSVLAAKTGGVTRGVMSHPCAWWPAGTVTSPLTCADSGRRGCDGGCDVPAVAGLRRPRIRVTDSHQWLRSRRSPGTGTRDYRHGSGGTLTRLNRSTRQKTVHKGTSPFDITPLTCALSGLSGGVTSHPRSHPPASHHNSVTVRKEPLMTHPELGGTHAEAWSARITIPATIDAAQVELGGLAALMLAKDWQRAALVYAFTRPGTRGPGAEPETDESDSRLSCPQFASLGVSGLNSHVTVRRYRSAWQWAMDMGEAEEAAPGKSVNLPNLPWPKDEGGGSAERGHGDLDNEWYTPADIADAARAVLGVIDLDPCSTEAANAVVKAKRFITAEEDGLAEDWEGRVFLNPPYSHPLCARFIDRVCQYHSAGKVSAAVVLTLNATDTDWWQNLAMLASGLCAPRHRILFWSPDRETNRGTQGHTILYLGDGEGAGKFSAEFSRFGVTW